MKASSRRGLALVLSISLFLLIGCSREENQEEEKGIAFKALLPAELILPQAITGLKAEAVLNGDSAHPYSLAVNTTDDSCTGNIPTVAAGNHKLTLIYYVLYGATPQVKLILAQQTQTVAVIAGKTITVSFPETAYNYPDLDHDTISNLYEYICACGHDPFTPCYGCPFPIGADQRITAAPWGSMFPSLAWTGSEFGVSWQDYRNYYFEIYFARVSASGRKIGSEQRITYEVANSLAPSLAWTGSEFGIAWDDGRDGNPEIYFVRVSASGDKIGTELRITSATQDSDYAFLAWTGSEFAVSWNDERDGQLEIYFARVSADGAKIGADQRITWAGSASRVPRLAWTGSELGVSWYDYRDGNAEIYFARVSASGAKIGADQRITAANLDSLYPSLTWTGSEFGVSWHDLRDGNSEIYFSRMSMDGAKIGSDQRITLDGSYSESSSLIWTGSEFGVSWTDGRDLDYLTYFARVSVSGAKIGSEQMINSEAVNAMSSSLTWTGSEFGVSWQDSRDGNEEIYFARIGFTP